MQTESVVPLMYYIVSFDDCGLESPLRSRSVAAAIALAQEAERNGCKNVSVIVPAGDILPLPRFIAEYDTVGASPAKD